jgi:hypothetical protein
MYDMRVQLCPTNVRSSLEVLCQRLAHSSILPELVWLRYLRKSRCRVELREDLIDRSRDTIFLSVTPCCVGAKQQKTKVTCICAVQEAPTVICRIRLQSRCGHPFILNPLLAPNQMSPYVVPDHVLERNLPASLTPTFWGALTVVSFDSLDTDPENHLVAQLSTPSKGSENTITLLSKPVNLPAIPHPHLYFDDGNITFRVCLCASRSWYLLIWRCLHRLKGFSIASICLFSVVDRGNSRISLPCFPSKRPPSRPPIPLL